MALSPLEVSDRFSNEVKRRRLMLGMSYRTLGRAIDVSRTTVYLWEKGKSIPNAKMLLRLAEALHVTEMELLYPRDNGEPVVKLNERVVQEIKRLRLLNEITQEEFAEKVGVTWVTVARWETGEVAPAIKYLPKFAEILGVSEEDLLNPSSGTEAPKKYAKARPSIPYSKNSRKEKIMT